MTSSLAQNAKSGRRAASSYDAVRAVQLVLTSGEGRDLFGIPICAANKSSLVVLTCAFAFLITQETVAAIKFKRFARPILISLTRSSARNVVLYVAIGLVFHKIGRAHADGCAGKSIASPGRRDS